MKYKNQFSVTLLTVMVLMMVQHCIGKGSEGKAGMGLNSVDVDGMGGGSGGGSG